MMMAEQCGQDGFYFEVQRFQRKSERSFCIFLSSFLEGGKDQSAQTELWIHEFECKSVGL